MTIEEFFVAVKQSLLNYSNLIVITHSKSAVDITPKGIDKASGVRFLSERTGIPLDEMLGIGDTQGDLPMLKIVGLPAAPSNASDDVRAAAKYIASLPGPSGVAEILRHFTLWT
jgi:hydroxymethylpyrimidine pyrophosphatase-like HAD family hydrolase